MHVDMISKTTYTYISEENAIWEDLGVEKPTI
jgi:hypothetical protein